MNEPATPDFFLFSTRITIIVNNANNVNDPMIMYSSTLFSFQSTFSAISRKISPSSVM